MLLENKNAVIYGAGGSVGGTVARAFAREGARVFLAGRTLARLDAVAEDILDAAGSAETAEVDALDRESISPRRLEKPEPSTSPSTLSDLVTPKDSHWSTCHNGDSRCPSSTP